MLFLKDSDESSFFRECILPQLRDGTDGPAAILYLAIAKAQSFFACIEGNIIFDFCKRVVSTQEVLDPKWCCAVRLLCLRFKYAGGTYQDDRSKLQSLLYTILKSLVHIVMDEPREAVHSMSQYRFVCRGFPVLPLFARCCEWIDSNPHLEALASSAPLKSFLESLIQFVFPQNFNLRVLDTEGGLGVFVLISFLRFPSVAKLFLHSKVSIFGSFLVDMVLRLRTLDFEFTDTDVKVRGIRLDV